MARIGVARKLPFWRREACSGGSWPELVLQLTAAEPARQSGVLAEACATWNEPQLDLLVDRKADSAWRFRLTTSMNVNRFAAGMCAR